ncbi:MAG: CDP-alcohol phosphatidyltransferase family protein, partial [Bacteroidetes bacterium]|nr:CDP-alcohol phosphatidyltransferase family protein [Bacteroidota bacterium]
MKKLGEQYRFIDLSDYGRPLSDQIARTLQNTWVTAIHLTLLFGITGLLALYAIVGGHFKTALLLLVMKSVIDGADGALARLNNKPSFTGRYLDSVFDIVLNLLLLGGI